MTIRVQLRRTAVILTGAAVVAAGLGVPSAAARPRPVDPPGTQFVSPTGSNNPDLPQLWSVAPGGVVFTDSSGTWVQPLDGSAPQPVSGPGSSVVGAAGPMLWVIDGTGAETWNNLASGASGSVSAAWRVPSPVGGLYLLLSPQGNIHVINHNVVADTLTDLGTVGPWSSSTDALIPGPNGVLVVGAKPSGAVGMTYLSYKARKTTPNLTGLPVGHTVVCTSVSATGAGCVDRTANTAIGISFSGAAPTIVPQSQPISGGPVITGTTMAWSVHDTTDDILHSVPLGGGTESVLSTPTLAAGKGVVTDGTSVIVPTAGDTDGDTGAIAALPDASGTPATIRPDPALSVQVSELAIGPGRVAWADNANQSEPLWSRTDGLPGPISLGSRTGVAHGLTPDGLFVSGRYTAYDNDTGYPVLTDGTTATTMTQPGAVVGLTGARMLYMRSTGGYHPMLYDLATHKATDLKVTYPSMTTLAPVALFGSYVYFFQDDGSLWRANYTTAQAAVRLAPGVGSGWMVVSGTIWPAGANVAWNLLTTNGAQYHVDNEYVTGGGGPRSAPAGTTVVGAGEAGLVLMSNNQDSLQSWDGANTMALSGVSAVTDGDRVAWIGTDGVARVAPVSYPVNEQPWSISPAVAAAGLDGNDSWSMATATSAPLTSCSISFVDSGGTTVDTTPCDPDAAALGEVRASWVPPGAVGFGTYTWQLNAGNADGPLLLPDGSSGQLSGPVTVGVIVSGLSPTSLPHGALNQQVVVFGYRFDANAVPSFTGVVRVLSVVVNSSTQITATVNVSSTGSGTRDVTVTDPGSAPGVCSRCLTIT